MRYHYYICIFHVVYCNTMLSRHLLDFTFRETTYNWSTDLEDVDISPFIQRVGPAVPFSASVLEIFRLFFTTTLMATIVGETNHYAREVLGESAGAKWEDVVEEDLWAFLGFALLMGINRLPQLRLYWSTDPVYHYLPIAERITRDRFLAIWRFLHFSRNAPSPVASASSATAASCVASCSVSSSPSDPQRPIDRLWKVRPVISAVVAACRANYRPHREQSIDEAMVAFKGRSSMKQYLPKKPVKRGFKIWVHADSHNGYVCEFECYTGKKGE